MTDGLIPKENVKPRRLPELDALRGIAAMLVLLFHYSYQYPKLFPGQAGLPFQWQWAENGIWLFFAISGFVICMTLERAMHWTDFVWARFSRLYPVYWAAMALTVIAVTLSGEAVLEIPATDKIANLTMMQGWIGRASIDPVYWTLAVELAFYLCMLGVFMAGWLARLEMVAALWLTLSALQLITGWLPFRVEHLLVLGYFPFFAIGMIFYRYHIGALPRWRLLLWQIMLARVAEIAGAEATLVAAIIISVFWLMLGGRLLWLKTPVLLWLGAISYPLYLVHQNIGYVIMHQLELAGIGIGVAAIAASVLALAIAHLLHRHIEDPAQRWLRQRKPVPARTAIAAAE
jgi:peptidoglycan/LPS O-acetylase OafA/YrhL